MGYQVLGIACLFAIQFVSFLEGRGISMLSLPEIILGFLGGTLTGGVLFSPRFSKWFGPIAMALFTTASVLLWALATMPGTSWANFGACFFGSMALPPLLTRFFDLSNSPGLHLGIAFGMGDFFWLFLFLLPELPSPELMKKLLMGLQTMGGGMAILSLWKNKDEQTPEIPHAPDTLARESVMYLAAIAILFFLLNALIDIPFYRMHDATFAIPAQVHLYIWVVYPLTGLFVDRWGADSHLLLLCLAGCILAPISIAVTEGTLLYWLIYSMALASRGAALVYLMLVFARIRNRFFVPGFILSFPLLAMLLSFGGVYLITKMYPGTAYILLLAFFLAASFSYISSHCQYALTLAGITVSAQKKESEQEVKSEYKADVFTRFATKYGISTREQDVLRLIIDGDDTTRIGETLHISENTVKTHVRQLLRKTETRNRIALAALFFNKTR